MQIWTVEAPSAKIESQIRSVFDYEKIATIVVDEGTQKTYKLLETLAQRLVERMLEETPAVAVTVEVRKFAPPTSASVDAFTKRPAPPCPARRRPLRRGAPGARPAGAHF